MRLRLCGVLVLLPSSLWPCPLSIHACALSFAFFVVCVMCCCDCVPRPHRGAAGPLRKDCGTTSGSQGRRLVATETMLTEMCACMFSLSVSLRLYVYMCGYIHMCTYIYIYIYCGPLQPRHSSVYAYVYVYIMVAAAMPSSMPTERFYPQARFMCVCMYVVANMVAERCPHGAAALRRSPPEDWAERGRRYGGGCWPLISSAMLVVEAS